MNTRKMFLAGSVTIMFVLGITGVVNAEIVKTTGASQLNTVSGGVKISRTLKLGDTGSDVLLLQRLLATYPEIFQDKPTGYFGIRTRVAVKKLQMKMGIEQAGSVGPKTLVRLNEILAKVDSTGAVPPGLLASAFGSGGSGYVPTSLVSLVAAPVVAVSGNAQINAMGESFVKALPVDWSAKLGSWKYFDSSTCFTDGKSCYGNNPTSPYGYPSFISGSSSTTTFESFRMDVNDAIVIFLRTPSQMRYFGFTQYLLTRGGVPGLIFASLDDTLNLRKIATYGSTTPGANVFDQTTVLVWTADNNTLTLAKNILRAQGVPDTAINFISLPIKLPLKLGNGTTSDTFSMLMRLAMPVDQQRLDAYIAEKPFYVVKISPKTLLTNSPAPTVGYASEISGVSESSTTQTALNNLVSDIKRNYLRTFALSAQTVTYGQKTGWDCIAKPLISTCNGDNHDALYSADVTGNITLKNPRDVVIIAGVNHQLTGKALYINHSVYDVEKAAGIISVTDLALLEKTALYHAGVRLPGDPRVQQYKNLYAYAISYDCTGLSYCMQIPAPTADNPVGLPPGTPFNLIGRSYVDPLTNVRPSVNEIVHHQTLIGIHK